MSSVGIRNKDKCIAIKWEILFNNPVIELKSELQDKGYIEKSVTIFLLKCYYNQISSTSMRPSHRYFFIVSFVI